MKSHLVRGAGKVLEASEPLALDAVGCPGWHLSWQHVLLLHVQYLLKREGEIARTVILHGSVSVRLTRTVIRFGPTSERWSVGLGTALDTIGYPEWYISRRHVLLLHVEYLLRYRVRERTYLI